MIYPINNSSVHRYYFNQDVLGLAKDIVSSQRTDYFFFQYDIDTYILLTDIEGFSYENYVFSCDSAIQYEFDLPVSTLVYDTETLYYELPDRTNPVYLSRSGKQCVCSYDTGRVGDLTITNTGNHYICYGSGEGMPHLREGGLYYEYAQVVLLVVIGLCITIGSIFRRVSR